MCIRDRGIRVWDIKMVNKRFNCRRAVSSRWYEYLLPTYVLKEPRKDVLMNEGVTSIDLVYYNEDCYSVPDLRIGKLESVLNHYLGTKRFHNFTTGKETMDSSCMRYVKNITISPPFRKDDNKTEWVSLKIQGQSFMLHQIRKMIWLATLIARSNLQIEYVDKFLQDSRIYIPNAPATGLLLNYPEFAAYNEKLKRLGYETIETNKYRKELQEFKDKFIYKRIFQQETETPYPFILFAKSQEEWLQTITHTKV